MRLTAEKCLHLNLEALAGTDKTFRSIYRVIFSHPERIMCERATTLRIHTTTYGEARDKIESLAAGIADQIGARGEFVGLCGDNCEEWLILFWAILRSGNKPYLINMRQPTAFTESVLCTLGAPYVISIGSPPDLAVNVLLYEDVAKKGNTLPHLDEDAPFADEIALTTSGTTLKEKICIYRGKNFAAQAAGTAAIVRKNPDMAAEYRGKLKHLVFLPLYHVFGLSAVYIWFSFFGATFVFPSALSPDVLLSTVRRHEVTHIFAVPLLWHAIEKSVLREVATKDEKTRKTFEKGISLSLSLQQAFPRLGRRLAASLFSEVQSKLFGDSIRFCITGGSYVKPSAIRLINALGYPLYNGYGMTEIGITSVELSRRVNTRLRSTIGKPFSFAEYRIAENGHLEVRGGASCSEMIISGERTVFEGWFDTGDLMSRDGSGRYSFCGRSTDVIIGENGENLNPDLIRQAFTLSLAINYEVIPDRGGDAPMLVVQIPDSPDEGFWEVTEREIEAGNATLPLTTRPRSVRYTTDPLMGSQDIKVSRTYLRGAVADGRVRLFDKENAPTEKKAENTDIGEVLRALFAELLEISPDGIDENANFLTDLGGTSLDYYTLISEIETRFGVRLPYESDNFNYSLRDLERLIKEYLSKCTNSSDGSH